MHAAACFQDGIHIGENLPHLVGETCVRDVKSTLAGIDPDLLGATLELMAVHELGHCRPYLDGTWHGLPADFIATPPQVLSLDLRVAYVDMKAARSEEAYGDLVGLDWARQHHPEWYARLHAWRVTERSRDLQPGSHHNTLAWVRLAQDGVTLAGPSTVAAAARVWLTWLAVDEGGLVGAARRLEPFN